ncbi:hypothetical protein ACVWWG_003818 [Bradyrhizobium sp. LB7.2]
MFRAISKTPTPLRSAFAAEVLQAVDGVLLPEAASFNAGIPQRRIQLIDESGDLRPLG